MQNMAEAELRNMIMNFRVSDLQVLLGFAGRNKTGKKQELQSRALDLLKNMSAPVDMKVRELHNRRYHNQLLPRSGNYEMQERPVLSELRNDRPVMRYDEPMNNNYGARCNPGVRPNPVNHGLAYSTGKSYIPPPPMSAMPSYYTYTDVKFRDLPFYDILHVIIKPRILVAEPNERFPEVTHNFILTPQQAHDISVSRESPGNFDCHLLLRFCIVDNSSDQEDNLPPNLEVKLNNKQVQLPNPIPTNRPGVEPKRPSKPINITPYAKLSPTVTNSLCISWTASFGCAHAFSLNITRHLTSSMLLQRLREKGMRNPDITTAMIKEKLQQGQDSDIATTSLRGSLICPLGKIRMELPCRAVTCTHLQCFDAGLYIQMNEKRPKWICPVCDKPAYYKSLVIDGLFVDISTKVPPECTEVQFYEDGSWEPILSIKEQKDKKHAVEKGPSKNAHAPKSSVEVVELDDSDTDETWMDDFKNGFDMKMKSDEFMAPMTTPMDHLSSDANGISHSIPPYGTPMDEGMPLEAGLSNDGLILPDLAISPTESMANSGIASNAYASGPFSQAEVSSSYCPSYQSMSSDYNAFDLFSLIAPQQDQQKLKELEERAKEAEPSSPDCISLE